MGIGLAFLYHEKNIPLTPEIYRVKAICLKPIVVCFHISFWNKLPLSKAPLPGPRSSDINSDDESLTDLQLFRKYCMPLRDTWPEAWSETPICLKHVRSLKQLYWTKLNLARCENISIYSTNFTDRSSVYILFFRPIVRPCRPSCSQLHNTLDAASIWKCRWDGRFGC